MVDLFRMSNAVSMHVPLVPLDSSTFCVPHFFSIAVIGGTDVQGFHVHQGLFTTKFNNEIGDKSSELFDGQFLEFLSSRGLRVDTGQGFLFDWCRFYDPSSKLELKNETPAVVSSPSPVS